MAANFPRKDIIESHGDGLVDALPLKQLRPLVCDSRNKKLTGACCRPLERKTSRENPTAAVNCLEYSAEWLVTRETKMTLLNFMLLTSREPCEGSLNDPIVFVVTPTTSKPTMCVNQGVFISVRAMSISVDFISWLAPFCSTRRSTPIR
jgi:hypothetical protein